MISIILCNSSPGPSQVQDGFSSPKSIFSSQVQDDVSPGLSQVQDNVKSIVVNSSHGPSKVQDVNERKGHGI